MRRATRLQRPRAESNAPGPSLVRHPGTDRTTPGMPVATPLAAAPGHTFAHTPVYPAAQHVPAGMVQRTCACGGKAEPDGECTACRQERIEGMQAKLRIGRPNNPSEQEADRVAERVVQQSGVSQNREPLRFLSRVEQPRVQRTLGDGHDLTSPRFSRLLDLEAAYDGESLIRAGRSGRGVQAIQHALYDLGFPLPAHGADGKFGGETKAAVKAFQRANPPLVDDGIVGDKTMKALDTRFGGAPALPPAAARSAPWTVPCVRSVLCPWSPHTIDVLHSRITLKSFDSISWADEKWDGTAWVPAPFLGGGYNTGTEIGILNGSCEKISETLYHEVLHAEQPTSHSTTLEKESYAYRIGEEFSIAMGLGGRPALRSTDPQGREFADPNKVEAFVATKYPSVPAGGGGEQIIGKAINHGHVRVSRPDGSIYIRPATVGEKIPGPMQTTNEVTHLARDWKCP